MSDYCGKIVTALCMTRSGRSRFTISGRMRELGEEVYAIGHYVVEEHRILEINESL